MEKKTIGLIVKLAASIVAIAAAVCVIVAYSDVILAFLYKAKDKVKEKLPCAKRCCDNDEFADYADI